MHRLRNSFLIAATYIGTVVGAGFASGQEVLTFFTHYGTAGFWGIGLATLLFGIVGIQIMLISQRIQAYSYRELNLYLFGKRFGKMVNLLVLVLLFGISSVMLAGTGSLFQEQLGLHFQIGVLFTLLLTYLLLTKGIRAIFTVNVIFVPLMMVFTFYLVTETYPMHGWQVFAPELHGFGWVLSPFLYAAFNLATAQAILAPLGREINDPVAIRWGGALGAAGIGILLFSTNYVLSAHMPGVSSYEIPIAMLFYGAGKLLHLVFLCVIYGEIFTTLLGNLFGLTRQLQYYAPWPITRLAAVILFMCYVISWAGFSTLLQHVYPLFGLLSLGFLSAVIWKSMTSAIPIDYHRA
jgi:uncharacterized membrane protein YkvI